MSVFADAEMDDGRNMQARAVDTITARQTSQGYAFETDDWQTMGYWDRGWWQTTIPYWVELFGAVDEETQAEMVAEMVVA